MNLGNAKLDGSIGDRDACHVPIIGAYCSDPTSSGESVRFVSNNRIVTCARSKRHGIIDPFLKDAFVSPHTPVAVVLDPGMTSNLTHFFDVKGIPELDVETNDFEVVELRNKVNSLQEEVDDLNSTHDEDDDDDDYGECRGCYT